MNKSRLILFAFILVAAGVSVVHAAPIGRQRIRFDGGWKFHYGDVGVTAGSVITEWKWKPAPSDINPGAETLPLDVLPMGDGQNFVDNAWKSAKPGDDVFHGRKGFAWFRASLPNVPGPKRVLHFDSVDDNATVYVNGKKLFTHKGWNDAFDVPIDSVWNQGGVNNVFVLVENTAAAGGMGAASIETGNEAAKDGPAATNYSDSDWRGLHLPHDFVVEGKFTPTADAGHGSLPTGIGWYRKTFDIAAIEKGRSLWLDFDGVYRDSQVWLNGKFLGRHKSGYTGFRYDITDAANYGGKNVLAVRCDARAQEGWWYEGGGIYRHVWLTSADKVHIVPDSLYITSKVNPDRSAILTTKVRVINQSDKAQTFHLEINIKDPQGRHLSSDITDHTVAASAIVDCATDIEIGSVLLWNLKNPDLYRVTARVLPMPEEGKPIDFQKTAAIDEVSSPFGIRTITFDKDKGFFLNGAPVKIQGTCNHQDFAGVGIAMPDSLLDWRIKKLKEMGSNAYRGSHNPVAPELLDACDRLGMLVMDENRHLGDTTAPKSSPDTPYDDLSDLKDMVVRDRNHPSIIIWSMCNEEGIQGSEAGAKIFAAMKKVTDELDGTRPISCAMNGDWGQGITHVEDLQGCNYNPGAYDNFHKALPFKPMFGSETASEVGTRGEYVNDAAKGYVSAYSVNAPSWAQTSEVAWKAIAERPFVAGGFVWTGFDYKGEPTPYAWPCVNSHFGIMDECGFPKDAYYYYQSWWGDKPVVHVFPHWNWPGQEGKPIDVWVHSNAVKVKLTLNNVSLGVKNMPRNGHLQWTVPYAPGRLTATGYDANGKILATDAVETTGVPIQIKLRPDRVTMNADGEDVILITAAFLDAKGRVVPYANGNVTFTANGAGVVVGVGNGDPSDHDPDRAAHRKAFHGLCLAVVQAKERGGKITFTANAPGLKSAVVTLNAK